MIIITQKQQDKVQEGPQDQHIWLKELRDQLSILIAWIKQSKVNKIKGVKLLYQQQEEKNRLINNYFHLRIRELSLNSMIQGMINKIVKILKKLQEK